MAIKSKNSISVSFVSPVETLTDKSQVKAAYKDLGQQIIKFAEAYTNDANVIISHSVVNAGGDAVAASIKDPADSKLAELQSTTKRVASGKTPANPTHKPKFVEPDAEEPEEDETPRVVAGGWTPPVKNEPVAKPTAKPVAKPVVAPADTVDTDKVDKIVDAVFKDLKATKNSLAIIRYLAANADKDVKIADIAEGSKLENTVVSAWIAQTSERVKAFESTDKRGIYRFNSSKVKV
jgi:hypothetical protein